MESFSAFQVVQIASAVLGGNLLTLMFVTGWKNMGGASSWRYFVTAIPLSLIALIILAA